MIPVPSGVRVWIATGHTDMRRGMQGLALQVQESLQRDRKHPVRAAGGSGQAASLAAL
jgi:transposase